MIGTVSAQAFGENFFDLFAKWTSEIFHLDDSAKPEASIGHNDLEEGEVREYATPQEMLDDFGIKGATHSSRGTGGIRCANLLGKQ